MTAASIFKTSFNTATVTVEAGKGAALIAALNDKGYQSMGTQMGVCWENGAQVPIDVIKLKTIAGIGPEDLCKDIVESGVISN